MVAAAFTLYPAIDLRGGRVVRLAQGDFDRETQYGDDPVGVARDFAAQGAEWLHVVDLDAARTGVPAHVDLVTEIARETGLRVETGGGIRSRDAAAALLDAGVARVVVGTAAVEQPELVDELCAQYPGRVAVGLDARGREVATRGWEAGSGADLLDLARRFETSGIAALVVTEIGRDGMLSGPDTDQLGAVLDSVATPVIASGGVGTLDHLRALVALQRAGRTLAGAIVGRALYEGRFTVADAVALGR
ncbi:MAG: 1-(5-phosphoribosyl)-5-[(5-phosphoribosylamino)methylideneamino]imidazole-4-carboxamide isomerase [Acidimicrobiia bacterium]